VIYLSFGSLTLSASSPEHAPLFTVELWIPGRRGRATLLSVSGRSARRTFLSPGDKPGSDGLTPGVEPPKWAYTPLLRRMDGGIPAVTG
jgi:hypothetical protein